MADFPDSLSRIRVELSERSEGSNLGGVGGRVDRGVGDEVDPGVGGLDPSVSFLLVCNRARVVVFCCCCCFMGIFPAGQDGAR